MGADVAPVQAFSATPHPALPQAGTLGGPVLGKPKVQPIVYASDTAAGDIEAALRGLASTSYWAETTSEYGVGKLTVLPAIKASDHRACLDDRRRALQAQLIANTSGANPVAGRRRIPTSSTCTSSPTAPP